MLVLSRRVNERIVIPAIDTAIQLVSIKPGVVRIGIEAPDTLEVFREEILTPERRAQVQKLQPATGCSSETLRELNHTVRNRMSAATVGLALLRRQIHAGMTEAAEVTLEKLERDFGNFQDQVRKSLEVLTAPPERRTPRALLVEDDNNERELLAGFLRMAGIEVTAVEDGDSALNYLANDKPDVVLMDMVLPGRDGPNTIRAIRKNPQCANLPIFALTGHPPERFNLDPATAGIKQWIAKPLDPEKLLRDLNVHLAS